MATILGISAHYHDSAAVLVADGEIIAAAQEERFTRLKHEAGFPIRAIEYCLAAGGVTAAELDRVAFYDNPKAKFGRLVSTYMTFAPRGFCSYSRAMAAWLGGGKLGVRRTIRRVLGPLQAEPVIVGHHVSHAGSAFFPSPFEQAAVVVVDGVGEWATTSIGVGVGNRLRLTHQIQFPHSLGLLYSAFTAYCGFRVNSGEYKLMGLAPFGEPVYADVIRERLIDLRDDGSFWLDMRYFDYCHGLAMTSPRFHALFGGPPRAPESRLDQRHMDLAASVQAVAEEVMLGLGRQAHRLTGLPNLVMAGGVALNCVANGQLLREGPFESLWVQPAAGDAGGALGAALHVLHHDMGYSRVVGGRDRQKGSLLGPSFAPAAVAELLRSEGVASEHFPGGVGLAERVAGLLASGKVVGWFQGRMEFGPRALGARSILADARRPDAQATLNSKIKFREGFRPFAPAVLAESAGEWFDVPPGFESPYMLLTFHVREGYRVCPTDDELKVMATDPDLCRRAAVIRSTIPAVTHIDGSARIQTVDAERSPRFHELLRAFHYLTRCPVLVNTSFNVRGEPIVCTPREALECFLSTGIDALAIEDDLVVKTEGKQHGASSEYLSRFEQD